MQNKIFKCVNAMPFAIAFFTFFICFNNTIQAQPIITQSDCFSISAFSDTVSCGTSNAKHGKCGTCVTITICNDKCAGALPESFDISTEDSCDFDVCRLNGDFEFNVDTSCHGCNPCTKIINYRNLSGMADNECAIFTICHADKSCVFHITLSSHRGTLCVPHCKDATITFK
jgi:hypothetical protein